MQSLCSLLATALASTCFGFSCELPAQDPTAGAPAAESPASEAPATPAPTERPRRRRRAPMMVIEAGMVHPVSGPPIENGVVVIRGERILAVGLQGELQLPPGTEVLRFPDAHIYPGLIDAATDAYTDTALQRDSSLNGGSLLADALVWSDQPRDRLLEHGVTTAYVTVGSPGRLRGQGAIVRPGMQGFELWQKREHAGLGLNMAQTGNGHPLQRLQQLESVGKLFDGLEDYREAQEKFEKELEQYEKDFAAYLEHHRKKNGKGAKSGQPEKGGEAGKEGGKKGAEKPAEGAPGKAPKQPADKQPKRAEAALPAVTAESLATLQHVVQLLSGAPEGSTQDPAPQKQAPTKPPAAPQGKPASKEGKPAASKDDGPKRPTYPKRPKPDPQKEALLKVLDGELPLRIDARRPEELRTALQLQREHAIPLVVFERAYGADHVRSELAEQGASVVLTDVLPHSLHVLGTRDNRLDTPDPTALPAKLDRAGVPFAIASGDAELAGLLPMMAAAAIGQGLSERAALRALTLTPAELLGIDGEVGSLARGKLADVLVTSGPLFASDSQVLLVVAKGRTEYQAR